MVGWVKWGLRVVLLLACAVGLRILLAEAHWDQALVHIKHIAPIKIVFACLCVLLGYVSLVGYDWLGLLFLRQKVRIGTVIGTTFLANAVSNMVGFALLSGGAVRMRCYTSQGVSGRAVAKLSLFCTLTFLLGLALTASLGLMSSSVIGRFIRIDVRLLQGVGYAVFGFCILLPFLSLIKPRWRVFRRNLTLPSARIMWAQYLVGVVDILATGSVLYLVLPDQHTVPYFAFMTLFGAGLWLGVVSHVPGGLGFFEAVMVSGLTRFMPASDILGALILYRVLYYFLPFSIASLVLLARETRPHWHLFSRIPLGFLPDVLAVLIAMAGVVLLLSGATPAATGRVDELMEFLPLSFIESSHLLASIVGVGLLLVARGVYHRLESAWHVTLALLGIGIVFSLVKGFDYEEALVLFVIGLFTWGARRRFYRPGRWRWLIVDPIWLVMMAAAVGGSLWLMFFSFKNVAYQKELWWEIASEGDASRSMRSMLVVTVSVIMLALYQMLRPPSLSQKKPSSSDIELAGKIARTSLRTHGFLALLGDKKILFSADHSAFVMYAVTWRSLIVMGDPVGPVSQWRDLIWRMREIADEHRLKLAFYEVSPDGLSAYLDAGLTLTKLGEEALVRLSAFELESSRYKMMRQAISKGQRERWDFEILSRDQVGEVEARFSEISSAWLKGKKVREKHFSLGAYSTSYIKNFSVAVVRSQGVIVAFANLWLLDNKQEMSVDLMRYMPNCQRGVMDFLFASLLVWGKEQGYERFSLGMAPLAGLPQHRLASLWSKMGTFIYNYGENFYNFQGVRMFKSKYLPEWRPVYLALTEGSPLPVLTQVALLMSDGVRGLFRR